MDFTSRLPVSPTFATGTAFLISWYIFSIWHGRNKLSKIPTIGDDGIISSYFSAIKYAQNARDMIQEGYQKHRGSLFKIPTMSRWIVVVSGQDKIDEIRRANDDVVSSREAISETLQTKYTLGTNVVFNPYHVAIIRTPLTRSIVARLEDLQDELEAAFADTMPLTEDWTNVQTVKKVMQVVFRTANRSFIGLPLCRDPGLLQLNLDFASDIVQVSKVINKFPSFMKPIVGRLLTRVHEGVARGTKFLGPLIEERMEAEKKGGQEWDDRPNDMITWMLEHNPGEKSVYDITLRILAINFAAIHTSSMIFNQVMFDLARYPEYIPALREEIEVVTREEALNKASLLKLVKVDSFIKESARFNGISALSMHRRIAKEDFTFRDGTVIPKGTYIAIPNYAIHHDEDIYDDPWKFNGLRFSKQVDTSDPESAWNRHSFATLGLDYMIFGHGRHACPGRFFAVNVIKMFVAHFVMNYDIALDPDASSSGNVWNAHDTAPNPEASVMIRKRRV